MCNNPNVFFLALTAICLILQVSLIIYYKHRRKKLNKQFNDDLMDIDEQIFNPTWDTRLEELYLINECTRRDLVIDGDYNKVIMIRQRN